MNDHKFLGEMYCSNSGIKITKPGLVESHSLDSMAHTSFKIVSDNPELDNSSQDKQNMLKAFKAKDFVGNDIAAEPKDELIHIEIRLKNKYQVIGIVLCRNFWIIDHEGEKIDTDLNLLKWN